ncbi:hypothetical protein ACHAQH_004043 [Verticillium albo-atrum]
MAKDEPPAGLQADSIMVTEKEGGFQIILGEDVRAKVHGVLEGCGEMNDQCYQDVNKILDEAHIQTDRALDSRQWATAIAFIARVWKSIKRLKEGIAALSIAIWGTTQGPANDKGTFWPESQASNVGNLPADQSVTVIAGGNPIATITQPPDTTTLEGAATPSVTAVTAPEEGFDIGDLVGLLDLGMSDRLNEYMQRTQNCGIGQEFDSQHPTRKRAGGTYGQALCAAESVVQGSTPGGPWNDLLLLNPNGVHFNFRPGMALEAMNVFAEFLRAYAPLMAVPEELANDIGVYILALAIHTIVENVPLAEKNRFKSDLVSTGTQDAPSSTATGCPEPTTGDLKDCPCSSQQHTFNNVADPDRQEFQKKVGGQISGILSPIPDEKRPECPIVVTQMQGNIFSSPQNNVHNHFCSGWVKENEHKMTVNAKGENVNPEPHLERRTPPPNPDSYKDWRFDLSFKPGEGGECKMGCDEAYEKIEGYCTSNAGGVYLYEKGSYDVDCGVFDYKVYKTEPPAPPPTTELREFDQVCYKKSDFDSRGGPDDWINYYSAFACAGSGLQEQAIKKGDKSTFIQWTTRTNDIRYQYNVWWVDGCTLANDGPSEVLAANPLMVSDPGHVACQTSLTRNWKDCKDKEDNGGIGGYIQIGCLMYELKTDENLRQF